MTDELASSHQADPVKRARLRWRARRGLLENDLILTRFLDEHEVDLTDQEVEVFSALLDMTDNDLMNLLLEVNEPTGEMASPEAKELIQKIRAVRF